MSTFGLVVIADLPSDEAANALIDRVEAVLTAVDPTQADGLDSRIDPGLLGVRVSIDVPGAVTDGNEEELFAGAPAGRAVLCVDGDEYGVTFSGWRLAETGPQCVYLSHLNDPDLDDQGEDAGVADRIRAGESAVQELADLYQVTPAPLREIESNPTVVTDNLGVIGDPFLPWLSALDLRWPHL